MAPVFFIDIDGTITDVDRAGGLHLIGSGGIGYFEYALRDLIVRKYHLSPSKALRKVVQAEDKVTAKDPFLALSHLELKVSDRELWREILKLQSNVLKVYPDAVYFVKKLYEIGYDLYIVTNNSTNRALAKLARAGLASRGGSKYFKKIYGPDVTGCTKDTPDFYRKVIQEADFRVEEIVMVGDEVISDMIVPRKTGIKNFIIVDRGEVSKGEGVCFVKDLRKAFKEIIAAYAWNGSV